MLLRGIFLFLPKLLFRMILHNKVNKEVLKKQLHEENFKRQTLSFYKFVLVDDPQQMRDELYVAFSSLNVFGRIYVAPEGINAQISVPEPRLDDFTNYINEHLLLSGILLNRAVEDDGLSFYKLKILVKHKVLSDGLNNSEFDIFNVGEHLDALSYHKKLNEPNTVVVDLRNHYEHEVGHFRAAVLPDVDTYKASIPIIVEMLENQKPENVMLYCTGGIRCEKFSAYLKHKGFKNVFQLKGGVINYVHQVRNEGLQPMFIGKNFVFDDRMGERVTPDVIAHCHQCGSASDTHVNCANEACHVLFIQCEKCAEAFNNCCSEDCKNTVALPVEEQKQLRKGKLHPNAHHKSKFRETAGSEIVL